MIGAVFAIAGVICVARPTVIFGDSSSGDSDSGSSSRLVTVLGTATARIVGLCAATIGAFLAAGAYICVRLVRSTGNSVAIDLVLSFGVVACISGPMFAVLQALAEDALSHASGGGGGAAPR